MTINIQHVASPSPHACNMPHQQVQIYSWSVVVYMLCSIYMLLLYVIIYLLLYVILVEYLEYELETEMYMFRRSHALMHIHT